MTEPARAHRATLALALLVSLSATLLYLVTAPGLPNLDGLGYLKLIPHNFAAGHLLFMPLLRAATKILGGDGLKAGRLIDAIAAGSGVLVTFSIARLVAPLRADCRFVATVAAAGLAVSYGYWMEGADLEAYAPAALALLGLVRVSLPYLTRPSAWRAATMGALLGLAVLCHLTHVLASAFVLVVCLADPRGRRHGLGSAAIALGLGGAMTLAGYAYAAFVVRGHHLEGAVRWVLSASHGFREPAGPYVVAEAIYGLARSLVWSPYLHEADAPRLIGQLLLGLALLVGLGALLRARGAALRDLPTRAIAAWVGPYALFALFFFGADPERWIFVLPALWIVAALLIDTLARRRSIAVVLVVGLATVNAVTAILPARSTWIARRAELVGRRLEDGDLLVFPGHSWDEYVSYYGKRRVEPFPISYYAARDGIARMWDRLDREAAAAWARGHAVYALRLFDEDREVEDDPAGHVELRAIGLPRGAVRAGLTSRFVAVRLPPVEGEAAQGVSLVRLDPSPKP